MQDERLEQELEAALRRAPEVRISRHFASRTLARVPASRTTATVIPATLAAACLLFVALGCWLVVSVNFQGLGHWLDQPLPLLSILAAETIAALAWLLRVALAPGD